MSSYWKQYHDGTLNGAVVIKELEDTQARLDSAASAFERILAARACGRSIDYIEGVAEQGLMAIREGRV